MQFNTNFDFYYLIIYLTNNEIGMLKLRNCTAILEM